MEATSTRFVEGFLKSWGVIMASEIGEPTGCALHGCVLCYWWRPPNKGTGATSRSPTSINPAGDKTFLIAAVMAMKHPRKQVRRCSGWRRGVGGGQCW